MELILAGDPSAMTWLRPDAPYAEVRVPEGDAISAGAIVGVSETAREGDVVRTVVTLTNVSDAPCSTAVGDVAITLPLQDRYDGTGEECASRRCHVHLHCDGEATWLLALRMGGEAPHLGMVLTEGAIADYSIERDLSCASNDRGIFLLHPAPLLLAPGESARIAWTLFPCGGWGDVRERAAEHAPVLAVEAERCVLHPGERAEIRVRPSWPAGSVRIDGREVRAGDDGGFRAEVTAESLGEREVTVEADGRAAHARLLVIPALDDLVAARIAFLLQHQQYDGPIERLRGALLPYDTEERHLHISPNPDHNAGRERIGMGMLLAHAIGAARAGVLSVDPGLVAAAEEGLARHRAFVERELVDVATGEVFDDAGPARRAYRLYNLPWFAAYFLQLHELGGTTRGSADALEVSERIVRRFYADGGERFYPIELPMTRLVAALENAGRSESAAELRELFVGHARAIAAAGRDYPAHEVNYEQSIVGPAADITLQGYELSGDPALLEAARLQRRVLEQFNGRAPDHRLHEVAIRHWDGYWFGKRRVYGDTLPHYWSGITGTVLARWARVLGEGPEADEARARAEASLRGVLPMIRANGEASCAHVLPLMVNGERARGADPLANDQDWALVFSVRERVDGRAGILAV